MDFTFVKVFVKITLKHFVFFTFRTQKNRPTRLFEPYWAIQTRVVEGKCPKPLNFFKEAYIRKDIVRCKYYGRIILYFFRKNT
jgi:hypothetical protein